MSSLLGSRVKQYEVYRLLELALTGCERCSRGHAARLVRMSDLLCRSRAVLTVSPIAAGWAKKTALGGAANIQSGSV
jgi:hypothetical protein